MVALRCRRQELDVKWNSMWHKWATRVTIVPFAMGNVQVRANALDYGEEVRFDSRGESDREIIRHRSLARTWSRSKMVLINNDELCARRRERRQILFDQDASCHSECTSHLCLSCRKDTFQSTPRFVYWILFRWKSNGERTRIERSEFHSFAEPRNSCLWRVWRIILTQIIDCKKEGTCEAYWLLHREGHFKRDLSVSCVRWNSIRKHDNSLSQELSTRQSLKCINWKEFTRLSIGLGPVGWRSNACAVISLLISID